MGWIILGSERTFCELSPLFCELEGDTCFLVKSRKHVGSVIGRELLFSLAERWAMTGIRCFGFCGLVIRRNISGARSV